jgi:GNAT superfamily N-acetyltransferase
MDTVTVTPVASKVDREAFVDHVYVANAGDPSFVPQLRAEELEKVTPGKNPFFEHARCQLFLARRGGRIVGRISAHIDELALAQPAEQGMGPGTGNWGMFEAEDETVAAALIATAEDWLRGQGMTRVLAPISLSVWEEPGLLVRGHDHPPSIMMGYHSPRYRPWIEALGYARAKTLYTYDLEVLDGFPPLIQRIVASGERNPRIRIRPTNLKRFPDEARILVDILNDAWSHNWGFVPITDREVAYTARKLKPLVRENLIMFAELDGEPVAFMMALPDINEVLARIGPKPSPLGWVKLWWWLRRQRWHGMRVPLMGVVKRLQSTRLASQLAFMLIEYIRRYAVPNYATRGGEIGWILENNQGMNAIAEAIGSRVKSEYAIYEKPL